MRRMTMWERREDKKGKEEEEEKKGMRNKLRKGE